MSECFCLNDHNSLGPDRGLYAFHLPEMISTVLGYNDHGGQHGVCAKTRIRDESPENDPTLKRQCRHSSNSRKPKAAAFLRCL